MIEEFIKKYYEIGIMVLVVVIFISVISMFLGENNDLPSAITILASITLLFWSRIGGK